MAFAAPVEPGDAFAENVGITTDRLPAGVTLARYQREGMNLVVKGYNGEIFGSTATEVAGYPANQTRYGLEHPDLGPVEGVQWAVNVDGRIILFTFTGEPGDPFDEWLPTAESIVGSFEAI